MEHTIPDLMDMTVFINAGDIAELWKERERERKRAYLSCEISEDQIVACRVGHSLNVLIIVPTIMRGRECSRFFRVRK